MFVQGREISAVDVKAVCLEIRFLLQVFYEFCFLYLKENVVYFMHLIVMVLCRNCETELFIEVCIFLLSRYIFPRKYFYPDYI